MYMNIQEYLIKYIKYKSKYIHFIKNQKGGTLEILTLKNINPFGEDTKIEKFLNLFYGFYLSKTGFTYNLKNIFTNTPHKYLINYLYNHNGEVQAKYNEGNYIFNKDIALIYAKYFIYKKIYPLKDKFKISTKRKLYKALINPDIIDEELNRKNDAQLKGIFEVNEILKYINTDSDIIKKGKITNIIKEYVNNETIICEMFYLILHVIWIKSGDKNDIKKYYNDIYEILNTVNINLINYNNSLDESDIMSNDKVPDNFKELYWTQFLREERLKVPKVERKQRKKEIQEKVMKKINIIYNLEKLKLSFNFINILYKNKDSTNNTYSFEEIREELKIYDNIYLKINKILNILSNINISIDLEKYINYKGISYPDCGTITLRNFIKILIVDLNNNFNINILKKIIGEETSPIIEYFKKYNTNTKLLENDIDARNEWAQIVNNHQDKGIVYIQDFCELEDDREIPGNELGKNMLNLLNVIFLRDISKGEEYKPFEKWSDLNKYFSDTNLEIKDKEPDDDTLIFYKYSTKFILSFFSGHYNIISYMYYKDLNLIKYYYKNDSKKELLNILFKDYQPKVIYVGEFNISAFVSPKTFKYFNNSENNTYNTYYLDYKGNIDLLICIMSHYLCIISTIDKIELIDSSNNRIKLQNISDKHINYKLNFKKGIIKNRLNYVQSNLNIFDIVYKSNQKKITNDILKMIFELRDIYNITLKNTYSLFIYISKLMSNTNNYEIKNKSYFLLPAIYLHLEDNGYNMTNYTNIFYDSNELYNEKRLFSVEDITKQRFIPPDIKELSVTLSTSNIDYYKLNNSESLPLSLEKLFVYLGNEINENSFIHLNSLVFLEIMINYIGEYKYKLPDNLSVLNITIPRGSININNLITPMSKLEDVTIKSETVIIDYENTININNNIRIINILSNNVVFSNGLEFKDNLEKYLNEDYNKELVNNKNNIYLEIIFKYQSKKIILEENNKAIIKNTLL